MKHESKSLSVQAFWMSFCIVMMISFLLLSTFLSVFYYALTSAWKSDLQVQAQRTLNALYRRSRTTPSDGQKAENDFYFADMLLNNPNDRIQLFKNNQLLYDSFPAESSKQLHANYDTSLTESAAITTEQQTYHLVLSRNIEAAVQDLIRWIYGVLLICVCLSVTVSILFYFLMHEHAKECLQVSEFLNSVSGASYPPPLILSGMEEIDAVKSSSNQVSVEMQRSMSNYKDAIDAFIHEVKTPLTAIMGYSELLATSDTLQDSERENAAYIITESRRLSALTQKIIYFLAVDKSQVQWKYIQLHNVMESAILSTRARARMKSIAIFYEPQENAYLYGDEELFITCIVNILDNAIKASSQGKRIIIEIFSQKSAVQALRIQDFGRGIPPEDLSKIFQPFYMLHKKKRPDDNGIGLGLSICLSIVQAHHCTIDVQSEMNMGTCVEIKFPAEKYQVLYEQDYPVNVLQRPVYVFPMQP